MDCLLPVFYVSFGCLRLSTLSTFTTFKNKNKFLILKYY